MAIKAHVNQRHLYAAFIDRATPALGVWSWSREVLLGRISDRQDNGHAFPGEHCVKMPVHVYNTILAKHNWPSVR